MRGGVPGWRLLLVVGLGMLFACASGGSNSIGTKTVDDGSLAGRLQILDKALQKRVELVGYRERTTPAGVLEVSVTLRSHSSSVERLEVRSEWFDEGGFGVEADSQAWRPLAIEPGAEIQVEATAPAPRAVSFQLQVRREKPIIPIT